MKVLLTIIFFFLIQQPLIAQTPDLHINWNKILMVSKSTATLQVVVNPMLRRGSPIYEKSFKALHDLDAEYVRYAPWFPYPRLSVAELRPPDGKKTYWNFSLIDPTLIDFLGAMQSDNYVLNFPTVPQWMYKTVKQVAYPDDPDEIDFDYGGGNELRDTTLKELSAYYAKLVSWYTLGGFTDELGKYHGSGHHFSIPYWEVLNEPALEHGLTPEQYTRQYDAIVNAINQVSPDTKFIGMAAVIYWDPKFFEYFLNPAHHKPGTPIDMISYHFYASANPQLKFEEYQYAFFEKANHFINCVHFIESIRKRLAPHVKTAINELGTFVSKEMRAGPIPMKYWNLSAAVYAYLYIELTKLGIDIIGESQLLGYPGQFPDVSMINWKTGNPNARYWVLKMIIDHLSPGDSLVQTITGFMSGSDYAAQAFITKNGRKVLLVNKRDKTLQVKVPKSFKGAKLSIVDISSGDHGPVTAELNSDMLEMKPYAVIMAVLNP